MLYESPVIEDLGTLESMTRADLDGGALDADFPDNTPAGDLTFSA